MGLKKYYLRYGRSARDRILECLGIPPPLANGQNRGVVTESLYPAEIVPSIATSRRSNESTQHNATRRSHNLSQPFTQDRPTPLSMLISRGIKLSNSKYKNQCFSLQTQSRVLTYDS